MAANPFLSNLPKSVLILGNAQLAVEKAARNDINELGNVSKADLSKLSRLAGLPINHFPAIIAKAEAAEYELSNDPKVNAAMASEVTMEQGDNALLIKQYRAAMIVCAACKRVNVKAGIKAA